MDLFLSAQDIQFVTFGFLKDGQIVAEKTFNVSPERYLFSLHSFFEESAVRPEDINRILVVNGPGSFTASRVSVTLANAFAFAKELPVIAVENPNRLSLSELLPTIALLPEHAFVVPVYDRPPNIT